jgi:hypothetical protein
MKRIAYLAIPFALLLAGCEDSAPEGETAEVGGKAAGDVLGGTISDDMLPLEELKSQSPPAKRAPEAGASGSSDSAPASEAATEATPAEEAPPSGAPAEEPGE